MPGVPPLRPPPSLIPGTSHLLGASRGRIASLESIPSASIRPPSLMPMALGESVGQIVKDEICSIALGLLEEQVQARVVHYKSDLQTNPELDAITAQVVEQLRVMQTHVAAAQARVGPEAARDYHEKLFRELLERIFRRDVPSLLVEKRMKEIHKRLARLFFQSELHEKTYTSDGATKIIGCGEQAVLYMLGRSDSRLRSELESFEYESTDVKERAFEILDRFTKDMQDSFLGRRSSELKRIAAAFQIVLVDFFCNELAPDVTEFASDVLAASGSFAGRAFPHRIRPESFAQFRSAFERQLMQRIVGFAEDQLLVRLADTAGPTREETLTFITDPRVFTMIVGEISDGVYEFLCTEGFLDLPTGFRQGMAPEAR